MNYIPRLELLRVYLANTHPTNRPSNPPTPIPHLVHPLLQRNLLPNLPPPRHRHQPAKHNRHPPILRIPRRPPSPRPPEIPALPNTPSRVRHGSHNPPPGPRHNRNPNPPHGPPPTSHDLRQHGRQPADRREKHHRERRARVPAPRLERVFRGHGAQGERAEAVGA